jgi:hypothetical protein
MLSKRVLEMEGRFCFLPQIIFLDTFKSKEEHMTGSYFD